MCLLAAKAAGASRVVMSDVDVSRLQVAERAGASEVHVVGSDESMLRGQFDCCIDCSGAESAVTSCIKNAKPGGVAVLVGMGKPDMKLPVLDAACREVDIKGIFRFANTYQRAIDLVASGVINTEFMITHRFSMNEAVRAFETALDSASTKSIKVVIDCAE